MNENLKGKICIVTGANSGIGKIVATALANMGATLIMVCRVKEKAQIVWEEIKRKTKNINIELILTDLSSQKEIRALASNIKEKYAKIDVLVNNAGGMNFGYSETIDHIETTFATNHLGYFLFTNLILDILKSADRARIINVASDAEKTGDIDFEDINLKKNYSCFRAYSQSKLANIMFTYELARKLVGTNIVVNCVHPGVVPNTKIGKGSKTFANFIASVPANLIRTPEEGAETIIWLASSKDIEGISGKYFYEKREIKSSAKSYDLDIAKRLWKLSEEMTGLN
jgi:NAD(P)-dependent dehydrogenase (short-subunit alcohol dehydrogenase family)